jgi:protein ImuB
MYCPLVTCVFLPRLELTVAARSRAELLGVATALAPEPGGQRIGEVSQAAEAFGIHRGMRIGEALARCPRLTLIAPDPAGVADHWEDQLGALESIGAAVEPIAPGVACFDSHSLLRLHGGLLSGVLAAVRRALGVPVRLGVAPSRFAAIAAARTARARRPQVVDGNERQTRAFLAPMPVSLLRVRSDLEALPEALERLGVRTLGELAALPGASVTDRFGPAGRVAHRLARGGDEPLRPRSPGEVVRESLELPEAADGIQLERALGLLIDRLLARSERRGRSLRSVVLAAALVEQGGTWRQQVTFREALADPTRMRLALTPRLSLVPAPVRVLRLAVERFGPVGGEQRGLLDDPAGVRRRRLREAVSQARVAAGRDAALRVLEVDPDSRLPERCAVLTPFEGSSQ